MTAEEITLALLKDRPGAVHWPMTDEAAEAAREMVKAGKLAVADAEANQGRGTYRLNAEPEPAEKPAEGS